MVDQAIGGNIRAISVLLALLANMQEPTEGPREQLSDQDREILEKYAQRELGTVKSDSDDEANPTGDHQGYVP